MSAVALDHDRIDVESDVEDGDQKLGDLAAIEINAAPLFAWASDNPVDRCD